MKSRTLERWLDKRGMAVTAALLLSAAVLAGNGAAWDAATLTQITESEAEMVEAEETEEVVAEDETAEQETEQETAAKMSEQTSPVLLSTDYPGISVKPGATASFTLYMINPEDTEEDMQLSAQGLPDGWSGYFSGSSNEISSIHVYSQQAKADSPSLKYSLTVGDDAEDGDYEITLCADGESGQAVATLNIHVTREEAGQSDFTAEYPEQQGAAGTKFSFTTILSNNGLETSQYSLSADAPEGWTVTFTPSSESSQVASVPVDAGAAETITVAITPTEAVTKGDYTINLTAASAAETLKLPLTVSILGSYSADLTTPSGYLSANAYAGEETKVTLSIQNTGNIDLENLQLSGAGSTDWTITFDESSIDLLEAGATREVTATIQPAENAIIGDYVAEITMSNDQISDVLDLRISVKNHTTWGYAAIAIIVVLIVGLAVIIRKYGRR